MMARFLPGGGSGGAQATARTQTGPASAALSGKVRVSYYEPDRREPELVIYDQTEDAQLSINEVCFRVI